MTTYIKIKQRLKKENEAIKNRIVRDIRNLFELENQVQNSYKPISLVIFIGKKNTTN